MTRVEVDNFPTFRKKRSVNFQDTVTIKRMMQDVHVKLNPGLHWQKLRSARRKAFTPANRA